MDCLAQALDRSVRVCATKTNPHRGALTPEELARRWHIGIETAATTLKATTQRGIRNAIHPIHRRYRTKQTHLRYPYLNTTVYSDTMFTTSKSIRGHTCAQIFVTDHDFTRIVPMKSKGHAYLALQEFVQDVGIPKHIHTDDAKELIEGKWKALVNEYGIKQTMTEPYSPWQNRAESAIRELKKGVVRLLHRTKCPKRLWCYAAVYEAEKRSLHTHSLMDRTPYEVLTGSTPDISEYLYFKFYDRCWYYDSADFPDQVRTLGRWLGVAHRVGQAMCYWVLTAKGTILARSTVEPVRSDEVDTDEFKGECVKFDKSIGNSIGDEVLEADLAAGHW